ncbi:unnamed protein product [Microthlaspi erraticum]|uniref:MADS-box domain-containing protein n=1 Tax=Microthlaspi erraticum TaxID=1685480 RepID=A0A6D2I748_9BRAS|nr:unnamed protein product [Microthlaspi erraticum]
MTRSKVKLEFISNDASRRKSFGKRNKGLQKKVNELSTLCGIPACAIIYSPYNTNPDVWPSNAGAHSVISEFRALPVLDRQKKMLDQETFIRQRIAKVSEQLSKEKRESRVGEMTEVMFQCLDGNMGMFDLNIVDLNDLSYIIDQKLKDLHRKIDVLGYSPAMEVGESSNAAAAAAPSQGSGATLAGTVHEVGSYSSTAGAAALFNSIQQQIPPPGAPNVGLYEQPWSQSQNQYQQQSFVEMMNHQHMSHAGEQMGFQFMGHNHHHPHHQPQQQQIPGYSSITPVAASSSSTNPVTRPNPTTNHIWIP